MKGYAMIEVMQRFFLFLVLILAPSFAWAHGATSSSGADALEASVASFSLRLVFYTVCLVLILLGIAILIKKPTETLKRLLFFGSTGLVVLTTLCLIGLTVYLNSISVTKGPVHWHADFQVWGCGERLDLKDPEGFSNRIGTPTFHEHNDERIHVEGVVVNKADVSLERFFDVVGGELNKHKNQTTFAFGDNEPVVLPGKLSIPTNDGMRSFDESTPCSDGTSGEVQAFVYSVNADKTVSQRKIESPSDYVLSNHSQVPPGDCIIIEFDVEKEKTDHMCQSYQVAIETGKISEETHGN